LLVRIADFGKPGSRGLDGFPPAELQQFRRVLGWNKYDIKP
jgi:hypothetical protein